MSNLVSQTIPTLKGGISQQPEVLKFPEQGTRQVNGWSSETNGLQKRPPIVFTEVLSESGSFGEEPYIHLINRDETEQYYIVMTGETIKIFDLSGREYSVKGSSDYIRASKPRDNLRLLTIADYTFIVNKSITVESNDNINLPNFNTKKEALINVRGGQYGRTLEVYINGTNYASYKIPDGSNASHINNVDTQFLARTLAGKINEKGKDFVATVGQGFIHIVAQGSNEINELQTRDGYNDQLINPVTHYVQTFAKLPLNAPNGYIVKIVGDASKSSDAFYVKYDLESKVWKECLGWDTKLGLNKDTMPHALIRQSDGSFELKTLDWSERTCGDEDTNPDVSFIDSTINDIFLYRNRLGILSGENVILSRTGKYFNFFPSSVATLSDDDPIDIAVSSNRINILKYAVPFNDELLLWSDEAQFTLRSQGTLSATSLELNVSTEYDISDRAKPYGLGRNVYFANPRSGFTSIYRYYTVRDVSDVKSAEDVTAYVPNYIPNGVFSIKGTVTENFCSILTSGAKNKIFIYKFLYIDEQLVQQSWSDWDFGENVEVLACESIGSRMHVILQNSRYIFLGFIEFTQETTDFDEETYRYHLDAKVRYRVPSSAYNFDTDETTIHIREIYGTTKVPFEVGTFMAVTSEGRVFAFEPSNGETWGEDEVVVFKGNFEDKTLVFGLSIHFLYEFSRFLIKQSNRDGRIQTVDTGRLQLRRSWINYQNSGFFEVTVSSNGVDYKYEMSGTQLGSRNAVLGVLNVESGQFRYPCVGRAEDTKVVVESKTPTPLSIIGAGWSGVYIRRTQNI